MFLIIWSAGIVKLTTGAIIDNVQPAGILLGLCQDGCARAEEDREPQRVSFLSFHVLHDWRFTGIVSPPVMGRSRAAIVYACKPHRVAAEY